MVAPVRVTGSSIISATPSRRVMRNVRPLLSPSLLPPCKFDRAPRPQSSLRSNRRVHLAFPFVGISSKIYSCLDRVHRSIGIDLLKLLRPKRRTESCENPRRIQRTTNSKLVDAQREEIIADNQAHKDSVADGNSIGRFVDLRRKRAVGREKGRVRGKAKRGRNARSVGRLLNLSLQVETLFILRARLLKLGESRS